jgi:hypothetical protein
MEDTEYFNGLVSDNESLTEALDDVWAIKVLGFAHCIASLISACDIEFEQKEIRFSACMRAIKEIGTAIANITETNKYESISQIKNLIQNCIATASGIPQDQGE